MQVNLSAQLSDRFLDSKASNSQRQVALRVSALADQSQQAPLNLCLVLDQSGSMSGKPLDTVKKAACALVDQMSYQDYISVVSFDHKARVIVEHQLVDRTESIKAQIQGLRSAGGTAIDEGMKLAIQELSKVKKVKNGVVSQAFILTDGENEHGDNQRCLQFAQLAAEYGITLHTLGFGDDWNQNVLEQIADAGNGAMCHIQTPEQAAGEFSRLLRRIQSVYLTNAFLELALPDHVRLAELKPIAQVSPDAIELPIQINPTNKLITVRLGDLMNEVERVVIVNLYINHQIFRQAKNGTVPVLTAQVRYDLPADCQNDLLSSPIDVVADLAEDFKPAIDPQVQTHILALAKYRQTQLAETKLNQGDRVGAATMLQSAAKMALQMGDEHAATVLQTNATRLQSGSDLNDAERKQTRMVSKTILQVPKE